MLTTAHLPRVSMAKTPDKQSEPNPGKGSAAGVTGTEGRSVADWERIEADYCAGILSLREIAKADGSVTEGAIRKRAKRDSWERDLGAKIQAKAESLVRKAEVRTPSTQRTTFSDRDIIEANATRIAQVRGEHRSDITRARSLTLALLGELEAQTVDVALFEQLGELLHAPDENGTDRLNDLYRKVIATPGRIDSAKKLSETLKNLIGLEREAYDIGSALPSGGDDQPPVSGLAAARRIAFALQLGLKEAATQKAKA